MMSAAGESGARKRAEYRFIAAHPHVPSATEGGPRAHARWAPPCSATASLCIDDQIIRHYRCRVMKLSEKRSQCVRKGGRRAAAAAFLFFLIKGLLWLAAGAGLTLLTWTPE